MAQQGKPMRVDARECSAYNSVKLVLLANGNKYGVESNTFFLSGKPINPLMYYPVPTLTFFDEHSYL
jgi:hypothetical protein